MNYSHFSRRATPRTSITSSSARRDAGVRMSGPILALLRWAPTRGAACRFIRPSNRRRGSRTPFSMSRGVTTLLSIRSWAPARRSSRRSRRDESAAASKSIHSMSMSSFVGSNRSQVSQPFSKKPGRTLPLSPQGAWSLRPAATQVQGRRNGLARNRRWWIPPARRTGNSPMTPRGFNTCFSTKRLATPISDASYI